MIDPTPSHLETTTSQIPALSLLMQLGYQYLLPNETVKMRGGRKSEVILFDVLEQFLRTYNKIHYRGQTYDFEEKTIAEAIRVLRDIEDIGLVFTNQKVWDLLRLGKSFDQTIEGDTKSHNLYYVDWENPENNFYHVTDEFEVERTGSTQTSRPDVVLFVNGIPFSVIECKRSSIENPMEQGIKQLRKYQRESYIPRLFHYSQFLVSTAVNEAQYGTVGTPRKFWSIWREKDPNHTFEEEVYHLINTPLSSQETDKLFTPDWHRFDHITPEEARQNYQNNLDNKRTVTAQDKLIYALCRPERLLEISDQFSLFERGERKIARYQQYFTVKRLIERVHTYTHEGARTGGVVWHTQGSGKSLTMVFLAEALANQPNYPDSDIKDPRILLVTDRNDLDDQIRDTFYHCGVEVIQANTGNHLRELLQDEKAQVITTVINKFDTLLKSRDYKNESPNIFVLVDESHRTQFGTFHTAMRGVLPRACFVGFTGTPVVRREKNTIQKFGGMVQPTYTIKQAIADQAVVPLLYEGRDVPQSLDPKTFDRWFERYTRDLTEAQKAQLKKKFATKSQLNQTDQRVRAIAWDINEHFRKNWQGTGLKGQLVTPRKSTALKYKKYLDEFGDVSSEVLISPPDEKEGDEEDDLDEGNAQLRRFWDKMMERYGSPNQYQENLIEAFKYSDQPEILIVVDKLLTGFDAPRNTVLYLTRSLKDHKLLQAIARVNRLYEGKDYGYIIDYYGVFKQLGDAIDLYDSLEEKYDKGDLDDTIIPLSQEWRKLEQYYSDLWAIFSGVANRQDMNALEAYLADDKTRQEFNEALSQYSRTLKLALSSVQFFEETSREQIQRYKDDLKFFLNLRQAAAQRYTDQLDFKQYQSSIQKLLDNYVGADDVQTLIEPVDIFNEEAFKKELEQIKDPVAKAETIATRTLRTVTEKMQEDEAFYQPFSEMLQELIQRIREQRYEDASVILQKAQDICEKVRNPAQREDIPEILRDKEIPQAYYGIVRNHLSGISEQVLDIPNLSAEIALEIDQIIQSRRKIKWQENYDIQNAMKTAIEDLLFEKQDKYGFELDFDAIDIILDKCVDTAKTRLKDV
jgi:type I restriction enzyme R subunit